MDDRNRGLIPSKNKRFVVVIIVVHCYLRNRPWRSLWSSDQSSCLQIRRSGFDSRSYQIFREVVGLERSPLSLVSTTEELLERKGSGSGLENLKYGHRDPSRWPRDTLYPQKLALNIADNWRSLGQYSSLVYSSRGFFFCCPLHRNHPWDASSLGEYMGGFPLGYLWPVHEVDLSPSSSTEIKKCMKLYLHCPSRLRDTHNPHNETLPNGWHSRFMCQGS
jgi:hypothetical protein